MSKLTTYFPRALVFSLSLMLAALVHAADLTSAKRDGLVGERADGYLGIVVASPSAEVKALVDDVNAKRRARYEQIARDNNIDVADVEARAGQKAIERTTSGGWVFQARWEQKP